jgi:hypothetical protein
MTKKVLPLAIYGQALMAISNMGLTYLYGIDGLIISMVLAAGLHLNWMYRIVVKNGAK